MKTISMREIREQLASEDAENVYEYRDLFDVYLNGCPGYNNYDNETVLDWYIQRHLPDTDIDDNEPVVVLEVLDDGNGQVNYRLIQHENEIIIEYGED